VVGMPEIDQTVEEAIREEIEKPKGKLTKADLEEVEELSLEGTKITDEGLKELAKLKKLTELSLYGRKQITDAGLKELAKLSHLDVLWLSETQVTKAGVAQLHKELPKCRIFSNATK